MIGAHRSSSALQPPAPGARLRFGAVVSIESARTCTVTIGGSATSVSGVKYAASCVPLPGAGCVLASDGADLFVVTTLAAAGRTLAPRAYRDTDQSITDATDTAVTFAAANSDAWACWAAGQPTRLTAPITGRYTATAWVKFAANATGLRSGWIYKNGTTEYGRVQVGAISGSPTQLTIATPAFDMTQGDYVQLYVRQTSGGALALTRDSNVTPALTLTYLGP